MARDDVRTSETTRVSLHTVCGRRHTGTPVDTAARWRMVERAGYGVSAVALFVLALQLSTRTAFAKELVQSAAPIAAAVLDTQGSAAIRGGR